MPKADYAIETANGVEVEPVTTMGDRYTYTVRLTAMGEQKVTIRYGNGEWTHLLFNGIAEIEALMKARSKFIVENQRVEDPDDLCHYSFRIWNNEDERLIVEEEAPCGSIDMGVAMTGALHHRYSSLERTSIIPMRRRSTPSMNLLRSFSTGSYRTKTTIRS